MNDTDQAEQLSEFLTDFGRKDMSIVKNKISFDMRGLPLIEFQVDWDFGGYHEVIDYCIRIKNGVFEILLDDAPVVISHSIEDAYNDIKIELKERFSIESTETFKGCSYVLIKDKCNNVFFCKGLFGETDEFRTVDKARDDAARRIRQKLRNARNAAK